LEVLMPPLNEPQSTSTRDPIGRIVVGRPVVIAEKLTLRAVSAVLGTAGIGAALVERDDGTAGIVSERDITRALADDADPDVVWSADVMSEPLVTAGADESILRVALLMIDEGIRHVGIVEQDEITGIVSARDLFEVFAEDALANS
jgi:CBS domain-containing protein